MKQPSIRLGFLAASLLTGATVMAQEPAPAAPATPPPAAPAANLSADLTAAVEKLATTKSYTWSQTMSFGNMEPRTTTGKKGSGGYVLVSMPGRDQEIEVLARKGKAAMKTDEGWVSAEAASEGQDQGPGRFLARMVRNLREPAVDAKELVSKVTDLKSDNGTLRGTLGEEAARELLSMRGAFGRRGGGGGGGNGGGNGGGGGNTPPPVTGAGGSISFTVANGVLTGYEITLTGKMEFNGEERDIGRTTKVSFTGLGTTTFDIPEAAAGLLAE